MIVGFTIHRADQRDVVHFRCQMREDFRNLNPRFTISVKLEGTSHERAGMSLSYNNLTFSIERLAVEPLQVFLGVESVHVAHAAAHKERDDRFSPGPKVRRTWRCG